MASPLVGGDEVLGVLALFGQFGVGDNDAEDFLREVAGTVGTAVMRYRERRQLVLERDASTVLSDARSLAEACAGLLRVLRSVQVDEVAIGETPPEAADRFAVLCSSGAPAVSPPGADALPATWDKTMTFD